jgi:hypothetical protein
MDADGDKKNKNIKGKAKKITLLQRYISDVGNVLSASWVRCIVQAYDGYNRLILGSRRGVLLNFRLFLVGLYITYQAIK